MMNNKKGILSIVLVFVLLLVGAYVLYDRLGAGVQNEQMIVHVPATDEPASTEQPTENATDEPASTDQPSEEATDEPASTEQPSENATDEPAGVEAPDFTVYDADGNAVQLSEYFGKPIVLNFWASWCGPCQSEMPDFNEKYLEHGDEVHFVMINSTDGSRETVETATAYIERNGYEFPVLFDTAFDAAMTYGAYSLPTSYFINADGLVIAQASGPISGETLERGIGMISE